MPYVGALIAGIFGAAFEGLEGFVLLGALGLLAGLYWQQSRDITRLKNQVAALMESDSAALPESPSIEPVASDPDQTQDPSAAEARPTPASDAQPDSRGQRPPPVTPPRPSRVPREPNALDKLFTEVFARAKAFFTTGNVVVRVGVVVLFFGVAFLLNYAYENSDLPLELRLASAGLGGIVLAAIGWRLRTRSDTYGLILQGAGIGVLYLTIFAAARLYELIPMSAAFGFLVALVVASSILAVLQKSQALAMFQWPAPF